MTAPDWIMLIVILPILFLLLGIFLANIPDGIVFMKQLFETVVEEWRDLPERLK